MAKSLDSVAIIGVGLIGGSIGLALRQHHLAERVIGIGRDLGRMQAALDRGAVTETTVQLEEGVRQASWIIVCAPVDAIPRLVRRVAAAAPPHALITDVGSAKQYLVQQIEAQTVAGQAPFVGSHPLAGSDRTGVVHAAADLLVDRTVVVTPTAATSAQAVADVTRFWEQLGAQVVAMSPAEHDAALAMTSHLPHVVAAILSATTPEEQLPLVGTGWRDSTRIAAGDVEMWLQILTQNRTSVLRCLEQFGKVLTSFEQSLRQDDLQAVRQLLAAGKQRRDALAD